MYDIDTIFKYHKPATPETAARHSAVRDLMKDVAYKVVELAHKCNERDKAIEKIQEAMMWTNAAIAMEHERKQQIKSNLGG